MVQAQDGKTHPITAASYLAFGDEDKLEGPMGTRNQPAAIAVETRAAEFADVMNRSRRVNFHRSRSSQANVSGAGTPACAARNTGGRG